jgi:Protein of unknown function (DUF4058)
MPLRDHFRPPLDNIASWEGLQGQWPAIIVQHLRPKLPTGFVCEPRVHLVTQIEVDIATYEREEFPSSFISPSQEGGVATAVWTASEPAIAVETCLPDYDEYEVRIYDAKRNRRLVAAIEIVSPANKDRPENRNAFVGKCAAMVQKGIALSIVDLVTVRQFSLYAELLEFMGQRDPSLSELPPHLYAASCRYTTKNKRTYFQAWSNVMAIGQTLPTLPLWLTSNFAVPFDLEQCYEKACHDLSIV